MFLLNDQCSSMKNFGVEVRGLRDVDNLLQDAVIILRPKNVILNELLEEILCNVSKCIKGNEAFYEEVRNELYTDSPGRFNSFMMLCIFKSAVQLNASSIFLKNCSTHICANTARIC